MSIGDRFISNSKGFPVVIDDTTPSAPFEGMAWFKPSTSVLSVYSSGAWVAISTGGGGSLPAATAIGDVLVADASLAWQATAHIDNGRY